MKRLKCFIACAFGQEDVDNIYSKTILPVLKENRIIPLRVDKINHNKNIDQKIVELIKSADFCIADLTYARPSVYYEAGYIHGQNKEVIFTVRKDHFKPTSEDPTGNYRIHFDLITKNIIDWTQPNNAFKQRLKARIKLVISPLQAAMNADKSQIKVENKWASQSLISKLQILNSLSDGILIENKYKIIEQNRRGRFGIKKNGDKHDVLAFFSFESLTQSNMLSFRYPGISDTLGGVLKTKRRKLTLVFNCLNKVTKANIQKVFVNYSLKESNNVVVAYDSATRTKIVIINKIKSDLDYLQRASEVVN
jgi:nucleoside 2-deoxyribosyltransferase